MFMIDKVMLNTLKIGCRKSSLDSKSKILGTTKNFKKSWLHSHWCYLKFKMKPLFCRSGPRTSLFLENNITKRINTKRKIVAWPCLFFSGQPYWHISCNHQKSIAIRCTAAVYSDVYVTLELFCQLVKIRIFFFQIKHLCGFISVFNVPVKWAGSIITYLLIISTRKQRKLEALI